MTLNTTSALTRTKRSLRFDKLGLQPSRRHFFWISRDANIVIVILKIGRMRYGHNLVMLAISAIEDWPSPNEFGLLNDMLSELTPRQCRSVPVVPDECDQL